MNTNHNIQHKLYEDEFILNCVSFLWLLQQITNTNVLCYGCIVKSKMGLTALKSKYWRAEFLARDSREEFSSSPF